jgi:predicted transposase YbfD/YdcC
VIIAGFDACSITWSTAVSACASSPIALLAEHSDPASDRTNGAAGDPAAGDLLEALAAVTDPRKSRGVRHGLRTVLAAAVCAVLAGARSYVAITEWAHDLPVSVRLRLGIGRRAPSESTFRRILQGVDPDELDTAVSGWLARRAGIAPTGTSATGAGPVRAIAVDGKTARGARSGDGRAVHLLGALDHARGVVLGQTEVDHKTNEITAFVPLLERIDRACPLAETVITADALHTQHEHARWLRDRGAHYVFIVKANQPTLYAQLADLPWRTIPVVNEARGRGHGRVETRTLQLCAIAAGIGFPHARLAARIVRRRRPISGSKRWSTETVHAVTSLGFRDVRADRLAEIIRGHWHIENRLHWVRDVVFSEDLSQIRTGTGPAIMAVLRNLAISRHRLAGADNIAAACRDTARHPLRAVDLLT